MKTVLCSLWGLSLAGLASLAQASADEPTRLVIECEDMQGVHQNRFGPGEGWQVGRWGYDLYQNMIFGGVWASRLRVAMTDEKDQPAEATAEIEVPAEGPYKVWVKYECPPFFNYAFGVKIEPLGGGAPVFDQTYGLREAPKHFCFRDQLLTGDLYWSWGLDHDAAEGYEARLAPGRYQVTLYKTKNPEPKGARSVDAILITSDLSAISSPRMPRYPLLDELRRANHAYFRFRNPPTAPAPVRVTWNHWNHRYPDFYSPQYRDLVKFYDAQGQLLMGGQNGDWLEPLAPGSASPWYDLGPTMNTESTSPFNFVAHVEGAKPDDPSAPLEIDLALAPNEQKIVKSFALDPSEASLAILVQPDLYRPEGVAATKKVRDLYAELTQALHQRPRLGPLPKKLRLFAGTGSVGWPPGPDELDLLMEFREALGLNTLPGNTEPSRVPALLEWARKHSGIVERSLAYHHTQDPQAIIQWVRDGGVGKQFYYVSYGDEIGLPAIDVQDTQAVEAFREWVKARGETPPSLGFTTWEQVQPLSALSADVAVQIGVLPPEKQADPASLAGLKKLYWYSLEFRAAQGIASFAEKTRTIRAALGEEAHTSANLGGMHPFYWMHQSSFIEAFKHGAMSLAWSEDYTYCQPEASRLVVDFEAAYLRKGASYHDTPMQFYCMPHWPGNTPEQLIQNAVLEWGQNVKDLDFFVLSPDVWSTENYVACRGGLPTFEAVRTLSGMAGLIEDHLLPARPEPAPIAMLLSEASDVWELEGQGQGAVQPGSVASNVSQEERKALWYALRNAGHRVDFVTEKDCIAGLLRDYAVLYVCGQNLECQAAQAIREWVQAGGVIFATAGAARKDEFDAPLTELDEVLGRSPARDYQRYRGPLRARLELLFVPLLERVQLAGGRSVPVYASREEFAAAEGVEVLGSYQNGQPAWITRKFGEGRSYYTGILPGQAYLKAGLPVTPAGKGGTQSSPWMTEPQSFDAAAAGMILHPVQSARLQPEVVVNHRGVVTNRLRSDQSTVITVVNLAQQVDGDLRDLEIRITGLPPVRRAWSCCQAPGSLPLREVEGGIVIQLPTLGAADVLVLEH